MRIACHTVAEAIATHYGMTVRELFSHNKRADLVLTRQIAWNIAIRFCGVSRSEVARRMGGFEKATVNFGHNKIRRMIKGNPTLRSEMVLLEEVVRRAAIQNSISATPPDTDVLSVARRIVDVPDFVPSHAEITALASAVVDSSTEVHAINALNTLDRQSWIEEREELNHQIEKLQRETAFFREPKTRKTVQAVADAALMLRRSLHTVNEKTARQRLETSAIALQTLFERN